MQLYCWNVYKKYWTLIWFSQGPLSLSWHQARLIIWAKPCTWVTKGAHFFLNPIPYFTTIYRGNPICVRPFNHLGDMLKQLLYNISILHAEESTWYSPACGGKHVILACKKSQIVRSPNHTCYYIYVSDTIRTVTSCLYWFHNNVGLYYIMKKWLLGMSHTGLITRS